MPAVLCPHEGFIIASPTSVSVAVCEGNVSLIGCCYLETWIKLSGQVWANQLQTDGITDKIIDQSKTF